MKIQYAGIKEEGKSFRVVSGDRFKTELDQLPEGRYRMTVDKWRKDKSLPQLGYYYACVLPMSWELLTSAGWEFTSLDEVDAFWKDLYANKEIVNRNTGEVISVPALKRHMTTTEFSTFVDAVRNHCAEYLGGYIPEPESQIQMQME